MNEGLVSIVIPCFNQAQFLAESIGSAMHQSHRPIEVIVIDDASTDCPGDVARGFVGVRYHRREANGGLARARNEGLRAARGEFLAFLDADDYFVPDGIEAGVHCLAASPQAAFAFGAYRTVAGDGTALADRRAPDDATPVYERLLAGNFIGMFATVLFRRQALLDAGGFDADLAACEDYDLLLRVSRTRSSAAHAQVVACYRRHGSNMSRNHELMLRTSLQALGKQEPMLQPHERAHYQRGLAFWKQIYG